MSWRNELEAIKSLGSEDEGVKSLADLHEARKRHLGQFFTPLSVVKVMWAIASQTFEDRKQGDIKLLDTSIGTGRLMHYAEPGKFHIAGVDIHSDVVSKLIVEAEKHELSSEILCAGMQDVNPTGFDIALLNPPFSINLESATLGPFPCVKHGRLGPGTAAQSDEYAVAQGLKAASIVIAVVPQSLAQDLMQKGVEIVGEKYAKRLRAVFKLGGKAFMEEGANVDTCIVVFGHNVGRFHGVIDVSEVTDIPHLDLMIGEFGGTKARLRPVRYDASAPVITMPVTGNREVRVVHSGRKIGLQFSCGGTMARVLNRVYRERVSSNEHHRLPAGVKYAGQGLLDVQVILSTEDPLHTFSEFCFTIEQAGGIPKVDPGLLNYLKRLVKSKPRLVTPFGHWVYRSEHDDKVKAVAKCRVPVDPKFMMAPSLKAGEEIELMRTDAGWTFKMKAWTRELCEEEAKRLFMMPETSAGWVQAHRPLQDHFPVMARQLEKEAHALGLHKFLNWDYQFEDLVEVCIRPLGCVVAWKQGLGKARLAAGLILLKRAKHGLVAMPACLLDEYGGRLRSAGLPDSMWKIIECPDDLVDLRQINVISNERLRMPISSKGVARIDSEDEEATVVDGETAKVIATKKRSRNTYAKKLRGRIGVMVCDEGDFLSNPESDQSRAVAQVSAKTLFALSGTPIANVPRNMINLAVQSVGDGVVGQHYADRHPVLNPASAKTMAFAERGPQAFADKFIQFEWVTNQFSESLTQGAKREVPKLRNLPDFRNWLAPFVKRRLQTEPQVRKNVTIPVPTQSVTTLDWEDDHLGMYLKTADEFTEWFLKRRGTPNGSNLIALLARIGAVEQAASFPQRPRSGVFWHGGLTNHQRYIVDRAIQLVKEGRRIVVFAEWPELLEIFAREINQDTQAKALCYHGGLSQAQRRRNIAAYRAEDANVLCASFGITQAGLDLYSANYALFPCRLWNSRGEDQSIYRLLRPQQTNPVHVERVHLAGSIHEYQAQMVTWKAAAADAGLDWGTPLPDDVEFLHLDTVLERFVDDLAKMRGLNRHDFRDSLKAFA